MSEPITQRMREFQAEQATHTTITREPVIGYAEAQYMLSRKGMADTVKGAVAGTLGIPGDIFSNFQSPGAEVEAWTNPDVIPIVQARQADYNSNIDPKDQPFTTEWFGQHFGAETDRAAFTIGSFIDPKGVVKKAAPWAVAGTATYAAQYIAALRNTRRVVPLAFESQRGALAGQRAAANMLGRPGVTIRAALTEAEKLIADGVDPIETWKRTNWILDPSDGNWKFQIPVEQSKINWDYLEHAFDNLEVGKVKLGDFLDNRLLYASYPQLKNVDVSWDIFNFTNPSSKGQADFSKDLIRVFALNKDEFHNTLVHEIEHFIQAYENFPAGGQPGEILGSLERNINTSYQALAENRYQRLLYKSLLDLPQETKDSPELFTTAFSDVLAKLQGIKREEVVIKGIESVVFATVLNDIRQFSRTGRYLSTERAVINLGLKGSILEQRAILFDDLLNRGKELGLDDKELENLARYTFFSEYKRLGGEVNARLASYDLKMSQGTIDQQRWLRETNPIDRRRQMLREEGIREEDLSMINLGDPEVIQYADWYGGQLQQKAAMMDLQEAIQAKLRAEARGDMAEINLGGMNGNTQP